MDFTMSMMDSSRSIQASQAAVAAMSGQVATYHATHPVSVNASQQQQQVAAAAAAAAANQQQATTQQQQQQQAAQHAQQTHRASMHDKDANAMHAEVKVQELTKDDSQGAFTPPPRVSSVGGAVTPHPDSRVEKGTDTNDFEPLIKVEIRGGFPGINTGNEKDKNSVVQLHFNSVNEVLQYFSQRTVSPHIDPFNLLASPELVRNINPDLVRNHFLYVPNPQDGVRVTSNGYSSVGTSVAQTIAVQGTATSSPAIVTPTNTTNTNTKPPLTFIKQERRRGEVPPGTIIHRPPPVDPATVANSFVCWVCGMDLQKSLQFEEHMVDQHHVEKPYRCEDCGVTFKRKAHLDRHRRIHLPVRPYQCGVCGKGFTRNEHVRRHSFTHSGEKPYHCPTCNKTFSRREHLSKHLLSHTKPPGPHSPPPGGHAHTPAMTTTLLLQTTDQNGRFVTINQASGAVPTSVVTSSPGAHTVHQGQPSVSGSTSGGGSSHSSKTASGEAVPRPYQCGVCGKAFIRNEHLRRHVLTHSGEKPYGCPTCGKAFSRREHLTKHIRSHASKTLVEGQQSSTPQPAHSTIQAGGSATASVATPHASLTAHSSAPNSILNSGSAIVATSGVHQPPPTAVAHSVATSHPTPVAHTTHLPPGTHYLPMFGLLAEVV